MFGTNEIVGKKYFKDAPADSLFVTSKELLVIWKVCRFRLEMGVCSKSHR